MTERKERRKTKVVNEWRKFQAKLVFVILSGICSFFLVPLLIGYVDWQISLQIGGEVVDLKAFVFYVVLVIIVYILFRMAYFLHIRRIQKGKYRKGSSGRPGGRK